MRHYGLIGATLGHSWSKAYFDEKFEREHIADADYGLYEIDSLKTLRQWALEEMSGFNITLPYKIAALPLADLLSPAAKAVGAINCMRVENDYTLTGHNTDAEAFRDTLQPILKPYHKEALILGTGGAAKAVAWGLEELGISYHFVSRSPKEGHLSYADAYRAAKEIFLIINATPVGMFPNEAGTPFSDPLYISPRHLCYDLIYNPEDTRFLLDCELRGAETKNGIEMLHRQAELSWAFWNEVR